MLRARSWPRAAYYSFSGGSGSLGRTPYLRCLALPHGQPPNVSSVSTVWRNRAMRFPWRARVHIGQRRSQNSGSNNPVFSVLSAIPCQLSCSGSRIGRRLVYFRPIRRAMQADARPKTPISPDPSLRHTDCPSSPSSPIGSITNSGGVSSDNVGSTSPPITLLRSISPAASSRRSVKRPS